jgi:hypothetical protein
MKDWAGIGFLIIFILGVFFGLRKLANPPKRTAEDFERSVTESSTALGAAANALQDLMQPEQARAQVVVTQMKEGRFLKKRREGKANDSRE